MENNIALVIDALCTKLGTTMENLVPAIVEFGKYDCQLTARVCMGFIIFGIALILIAVFMYKHTNYDILPALFVGIGIFAILIAAIVLVVALATLNEWNHFPEVMAYKYIISMIT
jgi:uncharacterized oligopeptide transporter (OPT) family protein